MNDFEWLVSRVGTFAVGRATFGDVGDNAAGIVVEPTHISVAATRTNRVAALIGWPTGRHHSLIKAAEARLALDQGAAEVWVVVDKHADDTAILTDLIAVGQGIDDQAKFGVVVPDTSPHIAGLAQKAGAHRIAWHITGRDVALPPTTIDAVAFGELQGIEQTMALLEAGVSYVFATDTSAATAS
ncbi:hypothetical protein QP027_00890 [Corynebacterium breve]|uniref:Deoxyribose-phosphate aldolase n=1 Tax=Corynebacterium breve TaxID=3049799 RepID=A0ABY8VH71_9CORY|nr:hypothetical protein [Corynebacterium breve]WIM67988.1 hypothetical protein QP027_00890 [Corynebacterium breve]